jgi:ribonuclease D
METLNTIIDTKQSLEALIAKAQKVDAVALDTEFVWERTFYPKLGLIQIALSDEDCYLIDPIAIDDLSPLGGLLSDRSIIKIFHDAPQDLTILQRATGATPQNIFDTKLAAGFSSMPATLSLSNLTAQLLDITLSKEETRTNWLKRPLSDDQIRYALDDVRYLRAIRVLLLTRIIGPKIRAWLQEELNLLNNPANYNGSNSAERFRKIRGSSSLGGPALASLKNLFTWREGMAKKKDRPRGHILKDAVLFEIAKAQPVKESDVQSCSSISDKAHKRYSSTIASIVATSLSADTASHPTTKKPVRLNNVEKEGLENLHKLIALKCELLGIATSLIGNSSELKQLIITLQGKKNFEVRQLRQTEGWRKNFLEDYFMQH